MNHSNTRLSASKSRLMPSRYLPMPPFLRSGSGFLYIPLPTRANGSSLHKKRESVSATLQSFVSNHHLLLGYPPASFVPTRSSLSRLAHNGLTCSLLLASPLLPSPPTRRAHWFPFAQPTSPLLPSPPLLDVCTGSVAPPALPFLAFVTVAPLLDVRIGSLYPFFPSSPYVCIGEDPFFSSSASPPSRLTAVPRRGTSIKTASQYFSIFTLHALPLFLGSPIEIRVASRHRCCCVRDGWTQRRRIDSAILTAVAPASSLRPCLAGFTSSNANSISSLHMKFETQYAKNKMSLRARWMGPVLTDRLGRSNPVAPASSLRPCLASFHSRSWPPLDLSHLSPFAHGLAKMGFNA
ncbi:hypothetical protein FB45DRAFT_1037294 [Roridomyces roridus]|uniref:Uncharacterized protein n=1 Tax=Roridomyces roridus TaxID=1738132 RepID=A0AAD7B5Z4_9AGAR|nr:hypothetical protein FB45DRAFT_1037294 [Roridomyces roridus]